MRIIFCGTPQFAVPTLEKLVAEDFEVALVLTNPDEPLGRGHRVHAPPVKQSAVKLQLPIFQPSKLKTDEVRERLALVRPEAIVVVAYGHIIPKWMIELPRLGCINLHASLLPKYRGAAPIQWALINGEKVTGNTTMQIDPGLDTGPLLLTQRVEITPDETTETLSRKLSGPGAELMVETLRKLDRGDIQPQPQDDSQATHAPMLRRSDGVIDWTIPADKILGRVRGFRPWPGAFSTFRGKHLHVWSAAAATGSASPEPAPVGTLDQKKSGLFVACGGSTRLELKEVQLEGRKRITGRDFANGVRLKPDERLGT